MKNLNFLTDLRNSDQVMTRLRPGNNQVKTTLRFVAILTLIFTLGVGNAWGAEASFGPSNFSGQGTSGTGSAISATVNGVTFACDLGYGTTQFRCYKNGTITISSSNTITAISFTWSGSYNGGLKASYTGLSTTSWTKKLGSQARLTACTVTYAGGASHTLSSAVSPGGGGSVSLSATSVAEGSTATATATPAAHYTFTSWSITGTGASLSSTTTNPTTVTMGTANATVTANFAAKTAASISFVNAGTPAPTTSGYYVGDSYTLPSTNNYSCNGKTFVGWSTVPVAETDIKPTSNFYEPGASATLAASQTFYAVFASVTEGTGDWEQCTSSTIADGDYLIVQSDYMMTNTLNSQRFNKTSIAISAGVISYDAKADWSAYTWHIAETSTSGIFTIKNGDSYVIGTGTDSKIDLVSTPADDKELFAITYQSTPGTYKIVSKYNEAASVKRWLRYGGSYFACYADGGYPYLFKRGSGYGNYCTTCAVTHTVSAVVDPAGKATVTLGATTVAEDATTTAEYSGITTGYEFVNWSISGTGASLSSTTSNPTTITMGTANVTVTANLRCITPSISVQPAASTTCLVGESPSLSVTAAAGGASLSYQWKQCATIDGVYSNVASGGTSSTYSPSTASAGTTYYKCVITNAASGCSANVTSDAAQVTVNTPSNFPNNKTIFIQAHSTSAWTGGGCVFAWFHSYGGSEAAQSTYWLFDATDGDAGKKLFAAVVPADGNLPYLDIQRKGGDNCATWWNKNGGCSYSDANGSNTIRSTGKHDDSSDGDFIRWNNSGVTMELHGDPSGDEWASSLADVTDQGGGVWSGTYENYAPANVAGTSQDFKIKTNYNGWIGNTGSNNNATLSGMIVGSTYNITATLDVTTHALTMSKTFVKGTVHFDMQEHGLAISDLTNVAAGSKISAPGTPSATGYDFGGWYKEPACTNAWNFGSDVVNETMTLYAKWTKQTYTITSTLNNCSSSPAIPSSYEYTGSAASLSYTITPSSGYRLPTDITVTGTTYTWNSSTGALVLTGTITSNVTITISAVQTHTVDWYVGGSAPANKIGDDGQTTVVDHGGKISAFPATTPDGSACDKTFVGWTNTSSYVHGTSPLFNDVAGSPTINADANFYAVFAEVTGGTDYEQVTSLDDIHDGPAYFAYYGSYSGSRWYGVNSVSTITAPVTVSEGVLTTSTGDYTLTEFTIVTVDAANHIYYIKIGDDYVIGSSSGSNTDLSLDDAPYAWTFESINSTTYNMQISHTYTTPSTTCYMKAGVGTATGGKFRSYPTTGQQISLFQTTESVTGHTINCADCGSSVTPTYTAASTGGTVSVTKSAAAVASGSTVKTCTSVDLTVTITPASHYTLTGFTATGLSTGTATISPAVGSTLPVSVAQTFTVTVSAGATGTLTLAPTFTAQTPLSITLETHSKGTFTPIGDIYSGESFTFPTVTPSDAECSSFLGWIEGTTWSGDGTETDPTAITGLANYHAAGSSSGTLTTTKTYTAVFGEKDTQVIPAYQKVTSAPSNWSGDYLIVRDDNSRAFDGSLSTLDAADNYIGVTISDGSITANSTVNASKWTIAKVGETSNYTIKSASGYYIGRTANSNGLNSSTSEEYTNTLAYSTDHVDITSSAGPKLQMNGGTRFRYYGTSQQVLQLYKYNPDAEVVAYTYCTNPACTPRYRVTINSATGGSPEADKTYEHADETITITANPAAGYSFTSWTITKTTGGDNVTSTLLTGDKPTTANTTFTMPAYDITIAATYTKKMVSTLEVKDGATVVSTTTGPVSGTVNISTGANKTLDVVITPSDAYDHSWTATVSAGSTYASITNVTDDGFRVNGLAQGDATITVNAPNDGSAKSVTFTVHVTDIMPEEIILKRDGSNTPIETLIMYYDETNSKGQYVKVNVGYSPANPTNKAFTFSSALTGKVGSHSHAPASGYEVLVANGVTSDAVNCTFTSSADGSVTKVLAVTVLPILSDRFVDYVHGNATQTVSARLSDDRYSIIPDINTPSLSDASDANPTSEDCETSHYHLVGWLPQTTAEALWAAGTPITDATEGLVRAGESVEATGQTWCAIWAEEQ